MLVERLLAGEVIDATALSKLGYEFGARWHLGLIAIGPGADALTRGLDIHPTRTRLRVVHDADTMLVWLCGESRPTVADVERLLPAHGLAGVSLAVGEPARGPDAFRSTHRSAQAALAVARRRLRGTRTRYLDVALEATLLCDEALADALVEGYLSPLDSDGGGAARRRTLRAIFDAKHNVTCAASKLNVNRRTVDRRLEDIERRLGYRLYEHHAEIEIALRVEELREAHPAD